MRDQLLGRSVTERDWVVVGGSPEAMLAKGYHQVGKSFPVFLHPKTQEEYALARLEQKVGSGHGGFDFTFDPSVSLEEDLIRRDLTINAIAMCDDGTLIDPYGGQRDLKRGVLRHVSQAFKEDPLRVLRVARFASLLPTFSIHPTTLALMTRMVASGELTTLSHARLWREWEKALLADQPAHFFTTLSTCGFWQTPAFNAVDWDWSLAKDLPGLPPVVAQRFAYLAHGLSERALTLLLDALKPPKEVMVLSRQIGRMAPLWWQERLSKTPEQWLIWCERLDGIRRPESLALWCDVMLAWAHQHQADDAGLHLLKVLLGQVLATDTKGATASGLQGPEVGQAIRALRVQAIAAYAHPLVNGSV